MWARRNYGQTDRWTDHPISRCTWQTFQTGGIESYFSVEVGINCLEICLLDSSAYLPLLLWIGSKAVVAADIQADLNPGTRVPSHR